MSSWLQRPRTVGRGVGRRRLLSVSRAILAKPRGWTASDGAEFFALALRADRREQHVDGSSRTISTERVVPRANPTVDLSCSPAWHRTKAALLDLTRGDQADVCHCHCRLLSCRHLHPFASCLLRWLGGSREPPRIRGRFMLIANPPLGRAVQGFLSDAAVAAGSPDCRHARCRASLGEAITASSWICEKNLHPTSWRGPQKLSWKTPIRFPVPLSAAQVASGP